MNRSHLKLGLEKSNKKQQDDSVNRHSFCSKNSAVLLHACAKRYA